MGGNVVDKKLDLATEQLLLRLPAVRALRRARMVEKKNNAADKGNSADAARFVPRQLSVKT